jgi:hypothetical protein
MDCNGSGRMVTLPASNLPPVRSLRRCHSTIHRCPRGQPNIRHLDLLAVGHLSDGLRVVHSSEPCGAMMPDRGSSLREKNSLASVDDGDCLWALTVPVATYARPISAQILARYVPWQGQTSRNERRSKPAERSGRLMMVGDASGLIVTTACQRWLSFSGLGWFRLHDRTRLGVLPKTGSPPSRGPSFAGCVADRQVVSSGLPLAGHRGPHAMVPDTRSGKALVQRRGLQQNGYPVRRIAGSRCRKASNQQSVD